MDFLLGSNCCELLVTANVAASSLVRFTVEMEAIHSSETSVLTREKWRHIQEDGIFCVFYTLFLTNSVSELMIKYLLTRR
jgi:hypothetical protein